jgi:predicted phage terminase large subunit-like protein
MEMARRSLEEFLQYESFGLWKTARHLHLLCTKLEAVERGEIRRLMVFMPPRHGKSEVVSKKFPAYFLGKNPHKEVIISSYSADLAMDFSRISRNTLKEWGEGLWNVNLAKDSGAVGRWGIEGTRGGLTAAGVGGPITGRGAHVAIIDDPFKNWQDAASKTIRDNVYDWYRSTLRTRLAPNGAIILVMTRWHEDDLAGRLLEESKNGTGEKWEVVSLPAVAEEEDVLGRKEGDVLWPERFHPNEYADIKKAVGTRLWISLYQQRPSPDEGQIFRRNWWKFYKQAPSSFDEILQSWDCTFKESDNSDFVVGQVWGKIGADRYLLDQVRARMDFPATITAIRSMTAKWPQASSILVEDKANGPAVIATLEREIYGIIPINPEGGKIVRAQAVSPQIESGNVFLPDPSIANWVHDYLEEFAAFPNGAHDDMVDSTTQALNRLMNNVDVWMEFLKMKANEMETQPKQPDENSFRMYPEFRQ